MAKQSPDISILDSDLELNGAVSGKGKMVVKGRIRGTLSAENVVIARGGIILADAGVSNLTVAGIFEGEVRVSGKLLILSTGTCKGKVYCKNIEIEANGILDADVNYFTKKNQRFPKEAFV